MKHIRAAALAAVALLCLALGACSSSGDARADRPSCTVSIVCDEVLDHLDELAENKLELIPDDGILLRPLAVEFDEGETAYDAFQNAARTAKLQFESDGDGENAYLTGIGNLYAGDCGANSGWFFEVNGEQPEVGCGRYELQDGDEIVFRYVYDYMTYFEP